MSRPRLVSLCLLAVWGLGLALPRSAYAQNPAAAEALFEQARAAMAAGSYDIACARFRDSDRLDPAVGTRFNLADCEARRGRIATAWSLFRGVLAELAQDDDRRPIAQARARALEPRLSYLTLQRSADTPPGVRVRVDGVELGEGSLGVPLPMDPGTHELALAPPAGGASQQRNFALSEGERLELPIRLRDEPVVAESAAPANAPPASASEPFLAGPSRQKWAYVAGGVGAAGVVFGAVTGIITLNHKQTADANCSDRRRLCNQMGVDANESGSTFGTLSVLGFGVGVIGLAAGAYLWLTTPDAAPKAAHPSIPSHRGWHLRPEVGYSPTKDAGFLALAGSF